MSDQEVRKDHPVFLRHDWDQILLDLFRSLLLRERQSMREPRHVRIDNDARLYIERIS